MNWYIQQHEVCLLPLKRNRGRRRQNSFLARGPGERVGLAWFENTYEEEPFDPTFTFVQIDCSDGSLLSHSETWPHVSWVWDMQIRYEEQIHAWTFFLAAKRHYEDEEPSPINFPIEGRVSLYQIRLEQDPWLQLLAFENQAIELDASAHLDILEKQDHWYDLLYHVSCIDKVSDFQVYWAKWGQEVFGQRAVSHEQSKQAPHKETAHFLSYCDVARGFVLNGDTQQKRYLLFLLQRVYEHEPAWYPRMGAGTWHLGLEVYDPDKGLIVQRALTENDLPIQKSNVPQRDLVFTYDIRMEIVAGPPAPSDHLPTCVAALVLSPKEGKPYESSDVPQQGGLFWVDHDGECLNQDRSQLGRQISLCCCGEAIIGTDALLGQRRLWRWVPSTSLGVQPCVPLDPRLLRTTVVAWEGERFAREYFWLVEEDVDQVCVSLRESATCRAVGTTCLEGVQLPSGPLVPLMHEQGKPMGVLAVGESVLVLGVNADNQFQLFRISAHELL